MTTLSLRLPLTFMLTVMIWAWALKRSFVSQCFKPNKTDLAKFFTSKVLILIASPDGKRGGRG